MAATDLVDSHDQFQALAQAFVMIIFSEIGDKTFLIAAILAMRHPRLVVFAGAFASLVVMSVLSAALGRVLPALVPRQYTQLLAALLFFVFGAKMAAEGRQMRSGDNEKLRTEMREAEEEILEDEAFRDGCQCDRSVVELDKMEAGHTTKEARKSKKTRLVEGVRNFCSLLLGPVFVQSFLLTFLGEWGDRSQIATVALGAAHNVHVVAFGTIVGHSCCTALAVLSGRYVSSKISIRHVTLGGAGLFLIFGVIYLYEALEVVSEGTLPLDPDMDSMAL
ncbi:UPF0016-domain-containing protein [Fistulina hepatica ATCC 64428]|uniref:GDT1 family protein n=1 Tax=Fistulina hepatica ATCC 64428 TaxID=1128425 RepID=A0A0D7ADV9_9AGAR|nr:UPF0016-domain-containing protein [Fistulina hepatica ATCC 64428]